MDSPISDHSSSALHSPVKRDGRNAIPVGKQIFCNRSLNMENIVAVGFDMDYTLAQYKPENFESLAYKLIIRQLVYAIRYPLELLNCSFHPRCVIRGLVVDKNRGNILKLDHHKYVRIAYHGLTEMSKEEKVEAYGRTLIKDAFDGPDYAVIDTLFSLLEACLFADLVDLKDTDPTLFHSEPTYAQMYEDVQSAVELVHRDGLLKIAVADDPSRYINDDTLIVPMLRMLRDSGRSTFLVTNSLWDYTNIVMSFLCTPHATGRTSTRESFDWLQYFDVVITGSEKPGFFDEENRVNLFEVVPESGMLLNTDNGERLPLIGDNVPYLPPKRMDKACKIFQGGNVAHLHKLLKIVSSSQVLYVGDQIYEDILQSSKIPGWRTMLVVPELGMEVELLSGLRSEWKQVQLLKNKCDRIETRLDHARCFLKFEDLITDDQMEKLSTEIKDEESQRVEVHFIHQRLQLELHHKFHDRWGQLMKTGYQNSLFAHQVERFACIYTSKVTNLCLYPPDKYFRPTEDYMPHEFDALGLSDFPLSPPPIWNEGSGSN